MEGENDNVLELLDEGDVPFASESEAQQETSDENSDDVNATLDTATADPPAGPPATSDASDPVNTDELEDEGQDWDTFLAPKHGATPKQAGHEGSRADGLTTSSQSFGGAVAHDSLPGAYAEGPGPEEGPRPEETNLLSRAEEGNSSINNEPYISSVDLATATPVTGDAEEREFATADPVDLTNIQIETERKQFRTRVTPIICVLAGLCLLLVVILLILFLGLGIGDNANPDARVENSTASHDNDSNSFVPVSAEAYVLDLLPGYTLEAMIDLPEGPQTRAYQWLINDPYLFSSNYTNADWRLQQRFALATLYFATGNHPDDDSKGWRVKEGWLDYTKHECSWQMVESDFLDRDEITVLFIGEGPCTANGTGHRNNTKETDSYVALRLGKNYLQGSLPEELALLSSLQSIDVSFNSLSGPLPNFAFGDLRNLSKMAAMFNQLSGPIPSTLLLIPSSPMEHLILYSNLLTGSIPDEVANLSNIKYLALGENAITGTLPSTVAKLYHLSQFESENNLLVGNLPTQLGLVTSLTGIHLRKNGFTGSIPSELGNLFNVTGLRLSYNQFSGSLPSQLSQLQRTRRLYVDSNSQLTGSIPSEFGLLTNVKRLKLSLTQISGQIPTQLGMLGQEGENSTLELLWLDDTLVSGIVPEEICVQIRFDCSNLICGCDCSC